MDLVTLNAAKSFTKKSLVGMGAIKGASCQVAGTKFDVNGNTVITLSWKDNSGAVKTQDVTIKKGIDGIDGKDGEQGETGVSIVGAHFNSNGKIVFELSDGSETAPISLPSASVDISPDSGNVIEQRGNGIFVPETDLSNFVEKEENKGLISDEEKAQIALNKSAIETLNGDESVVGSVAKQIAEALGKLNSLSKEIVDVVPSVADAKDNVIYLLKGEGTTYEMYSVVSLPDGSKNMSPLGSTEIDLDGYLTETKAKELYLALADVDKDTLSKLGTVEEDEVIYLSFNGSKILTLSQIESIVYKKSEIDDLIDEKLDKSAVVKSLDSTKTDDEIPSAKCVFDELEGKINSEQGSVNAGKALVINEEGNVVPGDAGSSAILTTEDKIDDIDKSKLPDGQMVVTPDEDSIIDDSTTSGNKTWSSEKINASLVDLESALEDKADKTDLDKYYSIDNATTIPNNADLNSYTTVGNYVVTSDSSAITILNRPVDIAFRLVVENTICDISKWYVTQRLYTYTGRSFVRTKMNNTWSAWQELATMNKVAGKSKISTNLGPNQTFTLDDDTVAIIIDQWLADGKTENLVTMMPANRNYTWGLGGSDYKVKLENRVLTNLNAGLYLQILQIK